MGDPPLPHGLHAAAHTDEPRGDNQRHTEQPRSRSAHMDETRSGSQSQSQSRYRSRPGHEGDAPPPGGYSPYSSGGPLSEAEVVERRMSSGGRLRLGGA
eukprot:scaffold2963_cov45-Phaeocystis_antarctica.AAC.1